MRYADLEFLPYGRDPGAELADAAFPNGLLLLIVRAPACGTAGTSFETYRSDTPGKAPRRHYTIDSLQAEMDAVAALPPIEGDSGGGAKRETPATSMAGVRSGTGAWRVPISTENRHASTCLASAADCRDRGHQGQGHNQEVAEAVQPEQSDWTAPASASIRAAAKPAR
jgi:hypothetical protein